MTFRSRKLLDTIHDVPCQVDIPHECNDHLGTHPMHANWQEWGRGHGHKAPDCFVAAGCGNAHRMIDPELNPKLDREERQAAWERAYRRTWIWLWTEGKVKAV